MGLSRGEKVGIALGVAGLAVAAVALAWQYIEAKKSVEPAGE